MNFLVFGQSASIQILLDDLEKRKMIEVKTDETHQMLLPVFCNGESISGMVTITVKRNSKLDYQAIKIEFIGQIDFFADRGSRDEFLNQTIELARPGILSQTTTYPFHFADVEKPFESYSGSNVQLRYFLRVTVVRRFMDLTKEQDILVYSFFRPPHPETNIQMEVGIEDSLHIEFEYKKSCYHLEDVIIGKIYFLLVRVKIKYMEIQILRKEVTGLSVNQFSDQETIAKFEIMDGAPVRGESIPIRLFLGACNLTPTMREVNRKFSVRYFLNLVLLDEEERRYYKQHEIILYRLSDTRSEPQLTCSAHFPQPCAKGDHQPTVEQEEQLSIAPSHDAVDSDPELSASPADDSATVASDLAQTSLADGNQVPNSPRSVELSQETGDRFPETKRDWKLVDCAHALTSNLCSNTVENGSETNGTIPSENSDADEFDVFHGTLDSEESDKFADVHNDKSSTPDMTRTARSLARYEPSSRHQPPSSVDLSTQQSICAPHLPQATETVIAQ